MSDESFRELCSRVHQGDPTAVREFFETVHPIVRTIVKRARNHRMNSPLSAAYDLSGRPLDSIINEITGRLFRHVFDTGTVQIEDTIQDTITAWITEAKAAK